MSDMESRVRERAYTLWEAAGRPSDRGDEFWHQALVELGQGSEPSGEAPSGELTVDTGMPFEATEQDVAQSHGSSPASAPGAAREADAAEATVPRDAKAAPPAATEAARNASAVTEAASVQEASARRSRGGGRAAGR